METVINSGASAIKRSINMLMDKMSNDKLIEAYDYIRFLVSNTSAISFDELECYALSEPALSKDWMSNEEDEFWEKLHYRKR